MSESLFARSLRTLGPSKVHELLSGIRAAEHLGELPPELEGLTALEAVDWCWPIIGRPEQQPPDGDWTVWAIVAGRGWGKSRTGSQFVVTTAEETGRLVAAGQLSREAAKILVVAPTSADLRDVVVEGDGGILRASPPWARPEYEPSKRRLTWASGVEAILISADESDRIRGVQGVAALGDEAAVWPKLAEAFSNLRFATRLGPHPRICITTTPRRRRELRDILAMPGTVITRGRTLDNAQNLAPGVVDSLYGQFGGTRLGRQELDGEMLDDAVGALWHMDLIDRGRVMRAPDLRRVVVAIDPSGGKRANNDETGIVAAGVGRCSCQGSPADHVFVLADDSGRYSPEGWAKAAVAAYERFGADRIVAETNFGGAMVEATLRQVAPAIPFRAVTASRGKAVRAEPVAAAYERGCAHHVGVGFRALEDQLCEWSPLVDTYSPDRLDALVWAVTELIGSGAQPNWTGGRSGGRLSIDEGAPARNRWTGGRGRW